MPRRKLLGRKSARNNSSSRQSRQFNPHPKRVQPHYSNKLTLAELINAESALGRTVFGPVPAGHQREFFTAQRNVWIWHESWTNPLGQLEEMTIRYEVHPSGVYKRAGSGNYQKIAGAELDNFRRAASEYLRLVKEKLYK